MLILLIKKGRWFGEWWARSPWRGFEWFCTERTYIRHVLIHKLDISCLFMTCTISFCISQHSHTDCSFVWELVHVKRSKTASYIEFYRRCGDHLASMIRKKTSQKYGVMIRELFWYVYFNYLHIRNYFFRKKWRTLCHQPISPLHKQKHVVCTWLAELRAGPLLFPIPVVSLWILPFPLAWDWKAPTLYLSSPLLQSVSVQSRRSCECVCKILGRVKCSHEFTLSLIYLE